MESSNKNQKEIVPKPKNQSVEGEKIYKTRKYVQTDIAKLRAEARRKRNQYLLDHKEEILKLDSKGRVKKVAELLKQDLNLDVNLKTLGNLIHKYVFTDITKQNKEIINLRDKYLLDHKEEIKKLEHKGRIKKVQEMLKRDLNLDVNYNKMYVAFTKYHLM